MRRKKEHYWRMALVAQVDYWKGSRIASREVLLALSIERWPDVASALVASTRFPKDGETGLLDAHMGEPYGAMWVLAGVGL